MHIFDIVDSVILPGQTKEPMKIREAFKSFQHITRMQYGQVWPTLYDIGMSMYNAEQHPVIVEVL